MTRWRHDGLEGSINFDPAEGWCHAGGLRNWYMIGCRSDHINYGMPCVIGWVGYEHPDWTEYKSSNCIFCGRVLDA